MKIKIRYENEYQTLEVENMELEKWLNISISEEESQEDYEKRIQDVIEERFNRPDYNSWHKHDRHTGNASMTSKDGTVEVNTEEAIMFRATDKSAFNGSIDGVHSQLEYEECCETLRSLGEEVEIRTYRAIDRQKEFVGILKSYDENTVTITYEDETEQTFDRKEIALIRQALDF